MTILEKKLSGAFESNKTNSIIIIFDLNADIVIMHHIFNGLHHSKDSLKSTEIIAKINEKNTRMKELQDELDSEKTSKIRKMIMDNPQNSVMVSNYKCAYLSYYWDFIWQELFNDRQSDSFNIEAIMHSISELQYTMMEYMEKIFSIN